MEGAPPAGRVGFASFVIVVALAAQPALKFFVSPYFGPAKDALVVALLLAGLGCALLPIAARRYDLRGTDMWLVLGTLLLVALYVADPAGPQDAAWASTVRLVVESWGLFLLGLATVAARSALRWATRGLVFVCAFESVVGVWQQTVGSTGLIVRYGYAFGAQVRLDPSGHLRSFGTFDDPFHYGGLLVIGLVVVCFGEVANRARLALIPLLGLGIYVSHVRTSQAIAVVVVLAWALSRRPRPWLVLSGAAVGCAVVLYALAPSAEPPLPVSPMTVQGSVFDLNGRLEGWASIFSDPVQFVTGNGVGARGSGLERAASGTIADQPRFEPGKAPAPPPFLDATFVDSSYLAVASDIGLVGLVLVVALFARVVVVFTRLRRTVPAVSTLGLALLFVVAADAFTRSSLNAFPIGFVALHLLGLTLGVALREGAPRPLTDPVPEPIRFVPL